MMKYLLMGTSSNFGNMFSMAIASVFLPFLPMLPTQILLNNFLYDMAQITIPTDHVDRSYISRPSRALAITTVTIVAVGLTLPVRPLGPLLGFTVPPLSYFAFPAVATFTYLALVEVVKRRVVRRLGVEASAKA
jgi:hypothetical protein